MRKDYWPLLIAALALAVLPFILDPLGLPLRSSIDVVLFAIACLGLNVLVGYTGLVSFGHGAWFGLGAYAAALSQLNWFPGGVILPTLFAIVFIAAASFLLGALILRRRGVYFSLLTLALTAMLFAVAYRWTSLTGGESGLGGVVRANYARPRPELGLDILLGRRRRRAADLLHAGALSQLSHRHGPRGDPRKRATRTVSGLPDQSL